MERISSNWTLFYKLFIPTFWITFFGSITAAALLVDYPSVGNIPRRGFQLIVLFTFLSGTAALALTLFRLKRVELAPDSVYATNYFAHYRYAYANVEKLEIGRFLLLSPATLHLRKPGKFGSRITFLAHPARLREYIRTHPEIFDKMKIEGLKGK